MGSQGSRGRELWSVPQHPSSRSVEDSPDCVVAHTEQETEVIPFGEYGARSPVDRDLPRHKVCAWMVVKGRGNDRGEGVGIGHVLGGCVPRHGVDKGIGYNEGGGGGGVGGGGGG